MKAQARLRCLRLIGLLLAAVLCGEGAWAAPLPGDASHTLAQAAADGDVETAIAHAAQILAERSEAD